MSARNLRPAHLAFGSDMLVMRLMTRPEREQKRVLVCDRRNWLVCKSSRSSTTAMTESRKSKNPLILGFQGRSQLQDIYGKLSEVMLSQPSTKIFPADQ